MIKYALTVAGIAAAGIGLLVVLSRCQYEAPTLPEPTPSVPPVTPMPTATPTPVVTLVPTPYATAPSRVKRGEAFVFAYFPIVQGGRYQLYADGKYLLGELGYRSTDKARTITIADGFNTPGLRTLQVRQGDTVVIEQDIEVTP